MKYDKLLSDYCRWDKYKNAIKLLKEHDDLDLTKENGIYFRFAIKHNNIQLLNALLEYYTKTKLQADDHDSMEYKIASFKLRSILQSAINSFEVSDEMQKNLDSYISIAEDTTEDELTDYDDSEPMDRGHLSHRSSKGEDSQHNSSILTENLLKHFNQSHLDSSLHSSSLSAQPLIASNSDMGLIGNTYASENDH